MCPFFFIVYLIGFVQLSTGLAHAAHHLSTPVCNMMSGQARSAVLRTGYPVCVSSSNEVAAQGQQIIADGAAAKSAGKVVKAAKAAVAKADGKKNGGHGTPMVIGLSHKTASVEVREKLSIPEKDWNSASRALTSLSSVEEAAVLSTCNRFEVYVVAKDYFMATKEVMGYLRDHSGLTDAELRPNLFVLQNEDATIHLLRVSAGLDSLVVGEGQILSQVKACYSHAIEPGDEEEGIIAGSAGKVLGRLLNTAVMSGKYVRSQTEIAKGAVSISSAAVELATLKSPIDLDVPLSEARVTIIGAGKMSRLAMTHLASHSVTKMTLMNRSRPRAEELAAEYPDVEVEVLTMEENGPETMWDVLARSDIAFTSTSATGCIVTEPEMMERVWAAGDSKLMLVDISVPRNVESECNNVPGVKAYNVDDLKEVVAANQAKRRKKMLEAELLLQIELTKFNAWQDSLKFVPAISQLQKKFEVVRQGELKKANKNMKGLSDKELKAVDILTKGILNKLLHGPMSYLRSDDKDGSKASLQQIRDIFKLD